MRKGILYIICLSICLGLVVLSGCEGEKGIPGDRGISGEPGIPGIDPELLQPADRYFGIGVLNANERAVNGDMQVFMTFDTTQRASRDTVVAARLIQPPLIDGVDGEEPEWGEQKSRIRLVFLNPDDGLTDPEISEVVCRAAWDDYYVYTFFQWKERKVTQRVNDRDSTIYDVSPSDQPGEIVLDDRRQVIVDIDSSGTAPETTFLDWVRVEILDADTIQCYTDPLNEAETLYCDINYVFGDTTLVWLQSRAVEDKLAIFWGDPSVENWSELAFREFFHMPGAGGSLPSNLFVDAWVWGSATSNPVLVMDDWSLTSRGLRPDFGDAPFVNNYQLPDSVPRFQSYRDPNYKTQQNLSVENYPLWYFDAVGYSTSGWDVSRAVYLPGIITTIPSDSRADIYAKATIDETGVWVIEIRRARKTFAGDDVVF